MQEHVISRKVHCVLVAEIEIVLFKIYVRNT